MFISSLVWARLPARQRAALGLSSSHNGRGAFWNPSGTPTGLTFAKARSRSARLADRYEATGNRELPREIGNHYQSVHPAGPDVGTESSGLAAPPSRRSRSGPG
jgi:hypothetical protein